VDDRRALNGILYLLWSGCRWRHLPREYGSPATCWRRLNEWRASDLWTHIRDAFLASLDDNARSEWETRFTTSAALAPTTPEGGDARSGPADGIASAD
jgi:transposase